MGNIIERAFAAFVLTVGLAGSAAAGPLDEAKAAFDRGDHAAAAELWRPLAEQGDAIAELNLGVAHEFGRGVPQDNAKAAEFYRLAAERGRSQGPSAAWTHVRRRARRAAR